MAEKTVQELMEQMKREAIAAAQTAPPGRGLSPAFRAVAVGLNRVKDSTPRAARSAVNSAANQARKSMIDSVHAEVNLTKTQVRNRSGVTLAGPNGRTSKVTFGGTEKITERSKGQTRTRSEAKGQRIALFEFGTPRWRPGSKLGAAVQISRAATIYIQPISGRTVGRGFIATFKSGKKAVVSRSILSKTSGPLFRKFNDAGIPVAPGELIDERASKGRRKGRLPVVLLRGPSVPGVLEKHEEFIASAERLSKQQLIDRLIRS